MGAQFQAFAGGVWVGVLQKGVNIIKRIDGSSFKVMVK